jgi:hypothetical protein
MPILILVIFFTVQESLLFLGNQAAGAAAREAARVAREGGGTPQSVADAVQRGQEYAASVGHGLIEQVTVQVQVVNDPDGNPEDIRATVRGHGVQVMPGFPGQGVSQVSQGPIESFRPDTGP